MSVQHKPNVSSNTKMMHQVPSSHTRYSPGFLLRTIGTQGKTGGILGKLRAMLSQYNFELQLSSVSCYSCHIYSDIGSLKKYCSSRPLKDSMLTIQRVAKPNSIQVCFCVCHMCCIFVHFVLIPIFRFQCDTCPEAKDLVI